MSDAPLESGEDVYEAAKADWKDETTAFERVRAVAKRTYEPQSADEIANRALTTPATARKYLEILIEDGFVTTTSEPSRSATLYRRSSESLVLERARGILRELEIEELADRIIDIQAEIQKYREETGADSPEDAALAEVEIDRQTFRAWQTTQRNLYVAKAALAIGQAKDTIERSTTG